MRLTFLWVAVAALIAHSLAAIHLNDGGFEVELERGKCKVTLSPDKTEDGWFVLLSTGSKVRMNAGKYVFKNGTEMACQGDSSVAVVRKIRQVVLMIRWREHDVSGFPEAEFDELFNGETHGVSNPTGSVKEFFMQQSYGSVLIESHLSGWITSEFNQKEAAGDFKDGQQERCHGHFSCGMLKQAIFNAVLEFEQMVGIEEFLQFDGDNDGSIDLLTVIHSGRNAKTAPGEQISQFWLNTVATNFNIREGLQSGLAIFKAGIHAARWSVPSASDGHEITHIGEVAQFIGFQLGAPFLKDEGSKSGVGTYDIMADASGVNGKQRILPSFSVVSKVMLEWLPSFRTKFMEVVPDGGEYTLRSFQKTGDYQALNLGDGEHIILENRRPDVTLPSGGILIWHIDMKLIIGELARNTPFFNGTNPDVNHPYIRLIQADGRHDLEKPDCPQQLVDNGLCTSSYGNSGDRGDFFNSSHEISDKMAENLNTYKNQGKPSELKLFKFSDSADVMKFTIIGLTAKPTSTPTTSTVGTASPSPAPGMAISATPTMTVSSTPTVLKDSASQSANTVFTASLVIGILVMLAAGGTIVYYGVKYIRMKNVLEQKKMET